MNWLMQVNEGHLDHAGLEELRRGVRVWLSSAARGRRGPDGCLERQAGLSLAQCLGLQESAVRARLALRNEYILRAADLLSFDGIADQSLPSRTFEEARRFQAREWPCWLGRSTPPDHATELQRALFYALRFGDGALPETKRQFYNILRA